jgi:diguanylate cyclase (GGDEF)-like protein
MIGMCASSALWKTLVPLLMPAAPPVESLAMTLVTAGVAAGGLPLNAAVPRLYAAHLVLTQAPVAATFIALGWRTYIVLALMTVGFVFTLFSAGRAYGRNLRDVNLLAHRLDGANRELERLASHDTLTELWNRQRFESALDIELERVRRYGSTCALIMLDVDHFKQVNDQYGHAAGDRVLMDLGELLAQETRAPDQVARWGGEEFMILLPETGADGAFILAERIRRRVAETRVDGPGHVTVSLGITTNSVNEERSVLLRRLDDALYEAKRIGRNCVCVEAEPQATTAGVSVGAPE